MSIAADPELEQLVTPRRTTTTPAQLSWQFFRSIRIPLAAAAVLIALVPAFLTAESRIVALVAILAGTVGVIAERLLAVRPPLPDPAQLEQEWRQAFQQRGVLPFLRRLINERLAPLRRMVLEVTTANAPGLTGTDETEFTVQTTWVARFMATAEQLGTGAIGLAGPRGVGKSTLIDHFAAAEDDRLAVRVSAPVQYEPREFLLHLFASVCRAVLRRSPRPHWIVLRGWVVPLPAATAAGAVLVWAGVALAWALIITGIGLVGSGYLLFRARKRGVFRARLSELAHSHLENIQYLRTHTTGWSGTAAGGGFTRSVQRSRQPQAYPELVDALRTFLAQCAPVVIGIDELDKIESPEQAQRFLNEIKSIFDAPGTLFLVSVSEDALAAFERRGLPIRDAFDSAFHEIVRVDYLTMADTAEMLNSRVIGLPEPFVWLAHCLAGGLPRDVVRTARAMVGLGDQEHPPSLETVAGRLVDEDVERKSHAFQLACREAGDASEVTDFIRELRRLPASAGEMLAMVPRLVGDGELGALRRQAAAYLYHCATLRQVFTENRVDACDPSLFDLLARAKQSLAVHPRLAWLQVDEFRERWELTPIPVD